MVKIKREDFFPVLVGLGLGVWATLSISLGAPSWASLGVMVIPLFFFVVEQYGLYH